MLFTLEALPAAEGDCLLLHWGTKAKPKLALVDGGPGRIYEEHLRPRLLEILDARQLDRLTIELAMVSHVDNDHVVGVKKLFRKLRKEVDDGDPPAERPFEVKRLWHNTFNDILDDKLDSYYQTLTASFTASAGGAPTPQVVDGLADALRHRHGMPADEAAERAYDIGLILAGHGEGRDLRNDHKFLFDAHQTRALNDPFTNSHGAPTLIATNTATGTQETVGGLDIHVVGPQRDEIVALQQAFDAYIEQKGLTAEAVLAAYADKSVTNLSSIVCIVGVLGKRILLTGDARGDFVLDGLRRANLLTADEPLEIEVLKVPHHGSNRNVDPDFFEHIHADAYVFSGNGKHGNPDRDTLEWVIDSRAKKARYGLYLTYPVALIDAARKAEHEKKGKTWKAARDSLAALFADRASEGYAFTVHAGTPIRIDLGDESIDW